MPKFDEVKCIRCAVPLVRIGEQAFHEGTRWGALGDFGELFVGKTHFELYFCPECGHAELFLPMFGEERRALNPQLAGSIWDVALELGQVARDNDTAEDAEIALESSTKTWLCKCGEINIPMEIICRTCKRPRPLEGTPERPYYP